MKQMIFAVTLMGAFLVSNIAMAHRPNVNKRQHCQQQRIHHGARSGQLTYRESKQLKRQQMHIRHDKRLAMADGRLSPQERQHINREQNKASRNIYHQKHDNQVRRRF